MRIDDDGKVWFEKNDRVRPKTVSRTNRATGQTEYVPHDKPQGGFRTEGGDIVERKLPDVVVAVDPASGQIQLGTWKDQGGSWRTRWEPCDWYELDVPETARKRQKADAQP